MLDLKTIDAATVEASAELNALIDIEWVGNSQFIEAEGLVPEHAGEHWEYGPDGEGPFYIGPAYSTNPTDAGEARRKAEWYSLRSSGGYVDVEIGGYDSQGEGRCVESEVNNNPGRAEALATTRAIVVALQAAEKAKGGE